MDHPDLLERLHVVGDELIDGIGRELPDWTVRAVDRIVDAWGRLDAEESVAAHAEAVALGALVRARIVGDLRSLFSVDVADQRSTPLNIVRTAYWEPTELLARLGISGVVRDAFDERHHPDDHYDLAPRALGDLGDPALGAVLLAWGLTKAKILRARAERSD